MFLKRLEREKLTTMRQVENSCPLWCLSGMKYYLTSAVELDTKILCIKLYKDNKNKGIEIGGRVPIIERILSKNRKILTD